MSLENRHSLAWFHNSIIPLAECSIAANSISARYGLTIFEGLRGYQLSESTEFAIFRLEDHLQRLFQSAETYSLTIRESKDEIQTIILNLIRKNKVRQDFYLRIDLIADNQGSWNSKIEGTLFISVNNYVSILNNVVEIKKLKAVVSKWKRIGEDQLPPSAKIGANYANSRLASLDAHSKKADVPLFLNAQNEITESSGSAILCVRNGVIIVPSPKSGMLKSITKDSIVRLCKEIGIETKEMLIKYSDLYDFDEIFLCGTSIEIASIESLNIDGKLINFDDQVTNQITLAYRDAVRGKNIKFQPWLTSI